MAPRARRRRPLSSLLALCALLGPLQVSKAAARAAPVGAGDAGARGLRDDPTAGRRNRSGGFGGGGGRKLGRRFRELDRGGRERAKRWEVRDPSTGHGHFQKPTYGRLCCRLFSQHFWSPEFPRHSRCWVDTAPPRQQSTPGRGPRADNARTREPLLSARSLAPGVPGSLGRSLHLGVARSPNLFPGSSDG